MEDITIIAQTAASQNNRDMFCNNVIKKKKQQYALKNDNPWRKAGANYPHMVDKKRSVLFSSPIYCQSIPTTTCM